MFLVQDPSQLLASDREHHTNSNGRGAGGAQLVWSGHALPPEKVSRREQRNRSFFAAFRNNRQLGPAHLKIVQTVGRIPLNREDLFRVETNDCSSRPRSREVSVSTKRSLSLFRHD